MRAVVLDEQGRPALAEVPEPDAAGELVRVLACGLCGSDVEKIGAAPAGTVLGHEVVAEAAGRRVALVHHLPCGECDRCLAGHESTCEAFGAATIVPGGFAERVRADQTLSTPDGIDDATATYVEPLACVLRAAERLPPGRVLVVGNGFVGGCSAPFSGAAATTSSRSTTIPGATGGTPTAPSTQPSSAHPAAAPRRPRHWFRPARCSSSPPPPPLGLDAVYRRELTVLGSRSATPRHMREAISLLPELDLPEPTVLPLERFHEGLELYRRGEALKVVFTP